MPVTQWYNCIHVYVMHGEMDTYLIVVEHVNGAEELILLQDAVVVGVDGGKDLEGINGLRRGDGPLGILGGSEGATRSASCCLLGAPAAFLATAEREARLTRRGVWRIMVALIEAVDVGVRSFGFVRLKVGELRTFSMPDSRTPDIHVKDTANK